MKCAGEPFYCFSGENYTEIIHLMYKWTFRSRYRRKYHLNIRGMYRRTFLLLQWWKLYRNYTFNVKVNLQMALQPKLTPKYVWNVQANLFIASMVTIIQKLYTTCTGEPFYCFNGENCTEIIHSMYKWTFRSRCSRK